MADELELLCAWRDGDQAAGGLLFERHFDELYGFFRRRIGDSVLAEDLVQETFLACVRNRAGLRGEASFRTYLFAAARSRLIDHYRRRGRAPEATGISDLVAAEPSPSTGLRARERDALLREAIARLSVNHQLVLDLYYVQGFRGPELAQVLGVPRPTARSRLRRARAALAEHVEQLR